MPEAQRDYGNLFAKTPGAILAPTTTQELASTLRDCHAKGEPVTIRNTGHSTNGQTLTDGTQVSVSGIEGITLGADGKSITVGAGNSWDDVIRASGFPACCPPIFPNNPGQKIQVGGTAAVGGVGYYCSKRGGFWNHVSSLKLVTMTGDIVDCSREENWQLFRYSLGGFGRVGVISELTIDLIDSKPDVFGLVLYYTDEDVYQEDFQRALNDPDFDGVIAQRDLSGVFGKDLVHLPLRLIVGLVELDEGEKPNEKVAAIRDRYREQLSIFVNAGVDTKGLGMALTSTVFRKEAFVYFSPVEESFWRNVINWIKTRLLGMDSPEEKAKKLVYPWTDCVVDRAHYRHFIGESARLIQDSGLARYLEKESFIHGIFDIDSFVTFGIRKMTKGAERAFPVALDLPQENQHALGVAIMPNLPAELKERGLQLSREISNLVYDCDGRRYLYGTHDLTRDQVEKHYGRQTIEEWQKLKDEMDPRHLLNIGVIEHLD